MNVLAMGIALCGDRAHLNLYRSKCGHEVRLLAMSGDADYLFTSDETAEQVVRRIAVDWPPDLLLCGCPEVYPPPRAVSCHRVSGKHGGYCPGPQVRAHPVFA